jgi:hypothetical protein
MGREHLSEKELLQQLGKWQGKDLWPGSRHKPYAFYCANCKSSRKLLLNPSPYSFQRFMQVALTSVFLMLVSWPLFGFRGLVFFVPSWAVFEVVYRARVRAEVKCPHCGFDPYLYMVDVQRARQQMEAHWRKKFEERGIPYPEKGGITQPVKAAEAESTEEPESRLDSTLN